MIKISIEYIDDFIKNDSIYEMNFKDIARISIAPSIFDNNWEFNEGKILSLVGEYLAKTKILYERDKAREK